MGLLVVAGQPNSTWGIYLDNLPTVSDAWKIYGSFSQLFLPQTDVDSTGGGFEPIRLPMIPGGTEVRGIFTNHVVHKWEGATTKLRGSQLEGATTKHVGWGDGIKLGMFVNGFRNRLLVYFVTSK